MIEFQRQPAGLLKEPPYAAALIAEHDLVPTNGSEDYIRLSDDASMLLIAESWRCLCRYAIGEPPCPDLGAGLRFQGSLEGDETFAFNCFDLQKLIQRIPAYKAGYQGRVHVWDGDLLEEYIATYDEMFDGVALLAESDVTILQEPFYLTAAGRSAKR